MYMKKEVQVRVPLNKVEELKRLYGEEGQTFSSNTKVVDYLLDQVIRGNVLHTMGASELLDETISSIISVNMEQLFEQLTKTVVAPIREQNIQMTMLTQLLVDLNMIGMTDNEKSQHLIELRKTAITTLGNSNTTKTYNEVFSDNE